MYEISLEDFQALLDQELADLPQLFLDQLEFTVIHVDDRPPGNLYGLYEGVPGPLHPGQLPDHITIFKRAIERDSDTREGLKKQVRKTLLHEIGHHFGMTEDEVRRARYRRP